MNRWAAGVQRIRDVLVAVVVPLLVVTMSSACVFKQKEVYREVSHASAVDCSVAQGDLRLLYHEKANVAERVTEGLLAIWPASLVVGIVTGTEATKAKVAIGEYNKAVDKRITQIRETCGVGKNDDPSGPQAIP